MHSAFENEIAQKEAVILKAGVLRDPHEISQTMSQEMLANLVSFEKSLDEDATQPWLLTDSSEDGLGAAAVTDCAWVNVGMMIAVRRPESIEWQLALVRRLNKLANNRLSIGLTKLAGTHGLKFGIAVERGQKQQNFQNLEAGQLWFGSENDQGTGHSGADMLVGRVGQFNQGTARQAKPAPGQPAGEFRYWNIDAFAQDSWKVRNNLTLEYGVMTPEGARLVSRVLAAFAVGLPTYSAFLVLTRAYYAFNDTRTPTLVNVVSVSVASAGGATLFFLAPDGWEVGGLALAHSLAFAIGAVLLGRGLGRRMGRLGATALTTAIVRSVTFGALATGAMIAARIVSGSRRSAST